MELMAPYLSRGYNVYIDSWYSSPTLWEAVGGKHKCREDNRLNRKNMPEELKEQQSEKGDATAMYTHRMVAVKWQDKKWVTILTMHDNIGMVDKGKTSRKTSQETKACPGL